jgi:hypothetical protein
MFRLFVGIVAILLFVTPCMVAQVPLPTPAVVSASPEPNEGIVLVAESGAFKLSAGGGMATYAGLGVPITKRFSGQFDTLIVPDAKKQFQFGALKFSDNLAHVLGKRGQALLFNPNNVVLSLAAGMGAVHGDLIPQPKFAWEVYGDMQFKIGQLGGGALSAGIKLGYFGAPRDNSGGPNRFRFGSSSGAAPEILWSH